MEEPVPQHQPLARDRLYLLHKDILLQGIELLLLELLHHILVVEVVAAALALRLQDVVIGVIVGERSDFGEILGILDLPDFGEVAQEGGLVEVLLVPKESGSVRREFIAKKYLSTTSFFLY